MPTWQSTVSKLADVLVELNPQLTRHQAYARASRVVEYANWRGAFRFGWRPADYAGLLFAAALTGAKRVKLTGVR